MNDQTKTKKQLIEELQESPQFRLPQSEKQRQRTKEASPEVSPEVSPDVSLEVSPEAPPELVEGPVEGACPEPVEGACPEPVEGTPQKSEVEHHPWFDSIADPIFIFDRETKFILDCNQAMIDRYGYTLDELRTMTPYQLHPPDELEIVERNIDDQDDRDPHCYTHLTKEGRSFPVEVHTNEIEYEGRDAWVSVMRDITERKQAEAKIIKLNREMTALNDIGQALISTLDLQETLTIITDHMTRLMGVEAASVVLHNQAQDDLWFAAASGKGAEFIRSVRLAMGQGIAGWVIQHGEPMVAPDVSQDTRWFDNLDRQSGLTTHSILCVPLQTQGQTIGAIEVMNKESGAFDQEDIRLLTSLAAPAATAIENARLYDQAQREIIKHKQEKEIRQESEEKYRSILENIEESYFEVDLAGNFTFFNDALPHSLGYQTDELMGMNYRQYMDDESAGKVFQVFNTVYQTGEPVQIFDWKMTRQNGTIRLVESSVSLMHDATGRPIGFRGIIRDVTGHKQAQAERERLLTVLDHQRTQLQTAAEVSRAVSSILDPETLAPQVVDLVRERFSLYYVGLFLIDQTGEWTRDHLDRPEPYKWAVLRAGTGKAGQQMLRQGHKLEIGGSSMIGGCIANKQARITLDVGEEAVRFENPMLPKTRSELALPLVSRGRPIGALSIQSDQEAAFSQEDIAALQTMADQMANAIANAQLFNQAQREINERKRTEEAMRQAEQRYRAVAESRVVGLSISDPEEALIFVNPAFAEILGYTQDELIGTSLSQLADVPAQAGVPAAGMEEFSERQERTQERKTDTVLYRPVQGSVRLSGDRGSRLSPDRHYETVLCRKDGSKLNILISGSPLTAADGSFQGTIAVIIDITERKRAEGALQKALAELEQYTHSLERQAAQLQVGAEVAREATAILDVQRLLDTAMSLISDRFGFYHAGAFLIDDSGEYAVMRAASSEGGQRMLARGHRLSVGKVGIVGYVAATGEPRIALDVGQDATHFAHSDLPDTRSEMGLPLNVRGHTIGVLDVQDTQEAAFSDNDVAALQTLADQLAVAIDNARLVERTEIQLRELSLLHGEYNASTWAELTSPERSLGYVYDRIDVMPTERLSVPAMDVALTHGETITLVEPDVASGTGGERTLVTPLKLHGQIIGSLGIQETDRGREWSPNEIALIEAVSDQVALALENAQHFAETQKSAQQRQVLNELAQALAAHLDVETVLEETYRGASRLLDTTNFYIALYDEERNELSLPLNVTESEVEKEITGLSAEQGITGYIVRTRESVLIKENVRQWREEKGIKVVGETARSWLGAPMLIGDRVLGVIAAQSFVASHVYDERDRGVLDAIASQTAIALQNAQLFRKTEVALAETEALYLVGEIISRLGTREETLQALADVLVDQLGYASSWLALVDAHLSVDKQTQTLKGIASAGVNKAILTTQISLDAQARNRNPAVQTVLSRKAVVINDVSTDERSADLGEKMRAVLGRLVEAPILIGNKVAGVIAVSRPTSMPEITERDVEVLKAVADQAAVALQNIRLLEETQRRAAQLATASEVARESTSILDVNQLLNETVHLISKQFGFYHAGVFLLDEQNEYAVLRAASSEGGKRMLARNHKLPIGKVGIVGYVSATGESRVALDVGKDAMHFVNPDLPSTRSEMGLPLKVREQVIGVLDVQSTKETAFSDEDVGVLQTLADQLAGAIANARLFQAVQADVTRRALINEVQQAATASLDPNELLHRAGEVISHRLERPSAVFIWESEEGNLRPVAVHDQYGDDVSLAEDLRVTREMAPTLFSQVIDKHAITVLDTLAQRLGQPTPATRVLSQWTTLAEQIGIQTGVYIPLVVRGQVLGVLAIAQPDGDSLKEQDFIEIIGTNLSVALESARLFQEAVATAEQLQEMDRLKNQFLANMSHELRTPLNSIIGFSRVILKGIDGPLTDMQRTDLEAVYNSGQHLLELINGILDIAKIQAGKMELSFEDTNLRDVIKVVRSTAIALVKDKPIELQQSIPQDLPTIRADPRRIRQILINLVGNATKFTDEGFIRIEVNVAPTEVIIAVADSGVGIPENKLGAIFDEFTQVDGSSTRAVGGSGLGLSITRHFVEMHGGRIWVESAVDAGSIFYVALPIAGPPEEVEEVERVTEGVVKASEGKSAGLPTQAGMEDEAASDRKTVLCVDDDEGVILLFRRYLNKQGYRVIGLSDSTAVTEKAQQIKPFAITLDVMMPEKDGWQVIQELKGNPDTRDIPVIICSIVADQDHGVSLGASHYLVKPIMEKELVTALERLDREGKDHHRVLIVDDHPEDRGLLRRMIESQDGYTVMEAAGGQEAIDLVQRVQPSVIILDLMMPDVNGFAVLESVKADKATRSIPIIVVTAKTLTQEERDLLNRGVESLLQKGLFGQQELLADVAAALERITMNNERLSGGRQRQGAQGGTINDTQ